MRLDDLNATLRIRSYYRKILGRELSPADICRWLEIHLTELDDHEKTLDANRANAPTQKQ